MFSEESDTLILNTDNSGFISVFEDCTFKNTNITDPHLDTKEKQEIWYRQIYYKEPKNSISIYI